MRARSAVETTSIAMMREDGTLYFHVGKTIGERLCGWTLGVLWFLVLAVIVAVLLWG